MTPLSADHAFGLLFLRLAGLGPAAHAQPPPRAIRDVDAQKLANGILGIMTYAVAPDVTTSSLAIDNAATSSPGLGITQLGGGFTWSRDLPVYLEGNAA
jgi:hypothetical protein